MIKRLEQFIANLSNSEMDDIPSAKDMHLATAALLVEVATIDQQFESSEWQQLQQLLISQCSLNQEEATMLIEEAQQASANSSSLYDFTQLVNRHFDYTEKLQLTENLWKIAYADGNLDKYEEHIIRRIADLIHISHHDFIKAKINVRDG